MNGLRPRKALGQHFLHQQSIVRKIVDLFNPQPDDTIVEIGPGRGALTFHLAERVAALHVIEVDHRLAAFLREQAAHRAGLTVHESDALTFPFCRLAAPDTPIRVIGNLPYNISTPLIFHLLEHAHCIRDLCLMVQKEVARRICAVPGGKDYGRLSIMVQQQCAAREVLSVAAGAFSPPPKVESAVVLLVPHGVPLSPVSDRSRFADLVRIAFSQRRKTIKNALASIMNEAQIRAAGVDPRRRPEQLSVADFASLSEHCR